MDKDEEPALDPEREIGRVAQGDTEQLIQESEITAAERPHAHAEHGSHGIIPKSLRSGQDLYDTHGECARLEFYWEEKFEDIAESVPYMCVKVDGCLEDILDNELGTDSILAGN